MSSSQPYPVGVLDSRPIAKRIGLIVLATDHTTELDFARLCDPWRVGVYSTRIAYDNPTTLENLRQTAPRLTAAAELLLPAADLDVVGFSCASASAVLGPAKVTQAIQQAKPGVSCVTPISAAVTAFATLGVRRIALLTPYVAKVSEEVREFFHEAGIDVCHTTHLGLADDREIARVSSATILAAGVAAMHPNADALYISCTALRALLCVEALEDRLRCPVVSSNQAMAWACLQHCQEPPLRPIGRLFHPSIEKATS